MSTTEIHDLHGTPGSRPTSNRERAGVYPSPEARARVMALYDAALARWPVPFEEHDVATRYGRTHVVTSGDPSAVPVVLLHGAGCAASMWRSIVGPLSAHFRVHAVDTIGDNGKSELAEPVRRPRTGRDYSDWLVDVWDRLGVVAAHVVGASMGGWIGLHHAALAPGRVRRLALLGPMGLPSWPATLNVLARLFAGAASRSPARRETLITWTVGRDPATRAEIGGWIAATLEAKSAPKLGSPFPLSRSELRAIPSPTLVLLGGRDTVVGDPRKIEARARRGLRDVEVEIFPDLAHALSVEAPERIASRLVAFLRG